MMLVYSHTVCSFCRRCHAMLLSNRTVLVFVRIISSFVALTLKWKCKQITSFIVYSPLWARLLRWMMKKWCSSYLTHASASLLHWCRVFILYNFFHCFIIINIFAQNIYSTFDFFAHLFCFNTLFLLLMIHFILMYVWESCAFVEQCKAPWDANSFCRISPGIAVLFPCWQTCAS